MAFEGRTIGKYQIIKLLGEGSMGAVYLGQDPFIDRPVAIKIAHSEKMHADSGEAYRRLFFNEAQAAGILKHPNITAIFDAGVAEDRYYIVMEYVHGGTTLEQFVHPNTLMPPGAVANVIYRCAMALDYAHRKGVIHRDVKPRNILLTMNQEPKISDFGLAVIIELADSGIVQAAGSPLYMSPEQIAHEPISAQADLFSLGLVLYELLTGKHPFAGKSIEEIQANIRSRPPLPIAEFRADLPDIFQRIIDKALAKPLSRRYKTGADLAGDLSLVADFLDKAKTGVSRQERYAVLQQLEFFKAFSDAEVWELINAGEWLQLPRGAAIVQEGVQEGSLYVLLDGEVAVSKNQQLLTTLHANDCFGEMGSVSGHQRSAAITAASDVTLLRLKSSMIDRTAVETQLRFHKIFLNALVNRLEHANEQLSVLRGAAAP
jgi:serine/threonine protein kinase